MIFISYSSDDCEFVEALHDVLVLAGYEVWRDRKKIRAGNSFPQEIERALRACSVLLIVVSNSFERSTWQGLELTAAIERQKPIVPIILGAGFERPIELSQFHQIRTRAYQEIRAAEFMRIVRETMDALGEVDDDELLNCDSSDSGWDYAESLESSLIGTRWRWVNEGDPRDLWIEFRSAGEGIRSWLPKPIIWKALDDQMVIFGPHVLFFDPESGSFKGATPNFKEANPIRSGVILYQGLG